MSARRSLSLLLGFILSGAGAFLLLVWIYSLLGWIPGDLFSQSHLNLVVVAGIIGAGIGFLSWLGFAIGRRRADRSSGTTPRGTYLRGFGLSLLVFLVLGTLTGLIISLPKALGQAALDTGSGLGATLYSAIAYGFLYGSLAVVPLCNGLLTGARLGPGALLAFLGGLVLAVCAAVVYLVPLSVLILLVHGPIPSCSTNNPPTCSYFYFGPSFIAEILDLFGVWAAVTIGITAGAAAAVGIIVMGLTNGT